MDAPHNLDPVAALATLQARAARLLSKITAGELTFNRYEHGGARLFRDGEAGQRELVADFYNEGDREFYYAAPGLVRGLLAALADQPTSTCPLCSRSHEADCDLAFSRCTCKTSGGGQ